MQIQFPPQRVPRACLALAVFAATTTPLIAQQNAPKKPGDPSYQIGTSLEATADPAVPRPNTKPCTVTLLSNQAFEDFNNKPFSYTPPAACPGPWAKVVFEGDFSIQPGVQFDRTAEVFFGNVDIYFGTTAEPLQSTTDTWHIERDVTDYTALFTTPQTGFASLGNLIEPGLNSVIFGTFTLQFYPADHRDPAPRTGDAVLPIPDNANGTFAINTANPTLSQTFTLPTNIEAAYLDVFAQSQNQEEQWFLCVPSSLSSTLGDCGNTSFREVEVTVDGTPAGVAPVFPWIYTGGIDPYLWIPTPGVQTLNFKPFRVDLSPFAGLLSNGQQHTIGISVFNAFEYFSTDAVLVLFEDHGSKTVAGAVTKNTLTAPNPTVVNNAVFTNGVGSGTITTSNTHDFVIEGYVNTSHGRVTHRLDEKVNFNNSTFVSISASNVETQNEVQTSTVDAKTTTQDGFLFTTKESHFSYPFTINLSDTFLSSGSIPQVTSIDQQFQEEHTRTLEGFPIFHSSESNQVKSQDSTEFVFANGGFSLGPSSGQASSQTFRYNDSLGNCFSRTLTSADLVLTRVENQKDCNGR